LKFITACESSRPPNLCSESKIDQERQSNESATHG
jgi:hypothetical protein